jgi:hypothetical protein
MRIWRICAWFSFSQFDESCAASCFAFHSSNERNAGAGSANGREEREHKDTGQTDVTFSENLRIEFTQISTDRISCMKVKVHTQLILFRHPQEVPCPLAIIAYNPRKPTSEHLIQFLFDVTIHLS